MIYQLMIFSICDYLLASCFHRLVASPSFFIREFHSWLSRWGKFIERTRKRRRFVDLDLNKFSIFRMIRCWSFHAWKLNSMYLLINHRQLSNSLTKLTWSFREALNTHRVKLCKKAEPVRNDIELCRHRNHVSCINFSAEAKWLRALRDEYQLNRVSRNRSSLQASSSEPFWRSLTMGLERH